MKEIVKKEASEEKKKRQKEDIILIAAESEKALKGAYGSFAIPGIPKEGIESYVNQVKVRR